MTGTIKQDAEGMADGIAYLVNNVAEGKEVMADTDDFNKSETVTNKIYIPYATYTGEEGAAAEETEAAEEAAEESTEAAEETTAAETEAE